MGTKGAGDLIFSETTFAQGNAWRGPNVLFGAGLDHADVPSS